MKANKSTRIKQNNNGYAEIISGLLVLLIAIIIGILIFWSVSPNMPGNVASRTEYFTGYTLPTGPAHTGGSNYSAQVITLDYVPNGASNSSVAVVCYNSTGKTTSSPTVTIKNTKITIPAAGSNIATPPLGYDQINVTYTPMIYDDVAVTETNADTVFDLLPIIAIVVIGSIMIGLIIGFGKGKKT